MGNVESQAVKDRLQKNLGPEEFDSVVQSCKCTFSCNELDNDFCCSYSLECWACGHVEILPQSHIQVISERPRWHSRTGQGDVLQVLSRLSKLSKYLNLTNDWINRVCGRKDCISNSRATWKQKRKGELHLRSSWLCNVSDSICQ